MLTLDQHIGVRIPGGQPNFMQYLCAFPAISRVRLYPWCLPCPHCVRTHRI